MTYESINSSPDTVRIGGDSFNHTVGLAFTFLGDDVLLIGRKEVYHANIISAMKKLSSGSVTIPYAKKVLDDHGVRVFGKITENAIKGWGEMLDSLEYQSLGKVRAATSCGRIWMDVKIGTNKDVVSLVSFWRSQAQINNNHLELISRAFKVKGEILWEGTDSREFQSYTVGQKDKVSAGETRRLRSAIAPHLSHEDLLSILMRAHYDARLSPFERRIARELQGIDPVALKAHTGGYPSAAEYQYRSKFSESFMPLLNNGTYFDAAVKKYLNSFAL